ncbi:MAG TPA: hypothetical protein VHI54_12285 [Actinomycetota bacterium]|nr:hypothetical protein [Actinomycetota bacterium]
MRAEFHVDDPKQVVATVRWDRRGLDIAADGETEGKVRRIFRPTPVVVDDPAFRSSGTSGPVVLHPGTLIWFRAAAQVRSDAEGLRVRFVPEGQDVMGWDPAGAYRTFSESIERKELSGVAARPEEAEAGETRPEGTRGPSASGTEAAKPGTPPSGAGPPESEE